MTSVVCAITHLRFTPAPDRDAGTGLLGFARFVLGDLVVDGVAVRRTLDGRLRLAFPRRTDRNGHEHDLVHPADADARARIETAVFTALGIEERSTTSGMSVPEDPERRRAR